MAVSRLHRITGCILGTAVGDALGLPYEKLTPRRASRLLGPPSKYRFSFGRGMISDDTEHTCFVAQSLVESGDDLDLFTQRLARRIRWWILGLPAGTGKATAKAALRLWLGIKPENAGVQSAGNGPAMRSAIIGAVFEDTDRMSDFVNASSMITHRDPRSAQGAVVIALAANQAMKDPGISPNLFVSCVVEHFQRRSVIPDSELVESLERVAESVTANQPTTEFAVQEGHADGVSGYTNHTVPFAVHAWLSHPDDFEEAIRSVILCGGDADTTAAIVGGILGAGLGPEAIPPRLIDGIVELPRHVSWMRRLSEQLAESSLCFQGQSFNGQSFQGQATPKVVSANPLLVVMRNAYFLSVVLAHGFRRLAPPY